MKKTILLFAILLIYVFEQNCFGQDSLANRKTHLIVKGDVFGPIASIFNFGKSVSFGAEQLFRDRHSVVISLIYLGSANQGMQDLRNEFNSTLFDIEYNFFLRKKKQWTGFFTGIHINYNFQYHIVGNQGFPENNQFWGLRFEDYCLAVGGQIGYKFYIKKVISVDGLVAIGYNSLLSCNVIENNRYSSYSISNLPDIRAAINIGYKF